MKRSVREKPVPDPRIKSQGVRGTYGLISYIILLVLAFGQWWLVAEFIDFNSMPSGYILGMFFYWAVVATLFTFATNMYMRTKFDIPIRRLSKAARKVAEGDFSVYIEPINPPEKYDFRDVMYEDFNKMVEELGSIETLTNDFIANVSHEIKTPISIIQNYASALEKEELTDAEREEYSHTIIMATRKLNTLVENILRLNKLDNQELKRTNEVYDICKQLCDCALQFEDLFEEKEIALSADLEDRVIVRADGGMMEIVWFNLLSNALKFTEPGGEIKLTQTSQEDSVTVSISDTGCGMDDETKKHIFEKFYQGDTSRSGEGNGLGLAISHRVVEKLGGTITVESELGKGSVFTVVLPINQ